MKTLQLGFERNISFLKCAILIGIWILLWVWFAARWGRYYEGEIIFMSFGVVIAVLLGLQYLQLMPYLIRAYWSPEIIRYTGDLPENTTLYIVKARAPWSLSFSYLGQHVILISEPLTIDGDMLSVVVDYETLRIKRGLSWVHTIYFITLAGPLMIHDAFFFRLLAGVRWTPIRLLFGHTIRVLHWIYLLPVVFFLHGKSVSLRNEQLLMIGYQESYDLQRINQFFVSKAWHDQNSYSAMYAFYFTGRRSFGWKQFFWYWWTPSERERRELYNSTIH